MKRKKFMKQIMAMGYQKSEAREMAAFYRERGMSYATALGVEKAKNTIILNGHETLESLTNAMRPLFDSMSAMVQNITKNLPDIVEVVRRAAESQAAQAALQALASSTNNQVEKEG